MRFTATCQQAHDPIHRRKLLNLKHRCRYHVKSNVRTPVSDINRYFVLINPDRYGLFLTMDLKEYTQFSELAVKTRHPWESARAEVIRLLMGSILSEGDNKTVLDVGCGDCFVISRLHRAWPECQYVGVDSALTEEFMAGFHAEHRDIDLKLTTEFNDANFNDVFDLALILDVLEHVPDDKAFLKDIVSALNPGSQVLITVPAHPALFCSHDRWLGHCRRYTRKGLVDLIQNAGLRITRQGYFFSLLLVPRLLICVAEKMGWRRRLEDNGIGRWQGGKRLSRWISYILYCNAHVDILLSKLRLPHLGLSCYVLCQKSP